MPQLLGACATTIWGMCHKFLWHVPQVFVAYMPQLFGVCATTFEACATTFRDMCHNFLWHVPQPFVASTTTFCGVCPNFVAYAPFFVTCRILVTNPPFLHTVSLMLNIKQRECECISLPILKSLVWADSVPNLSVQLQHRMLLLVPPGNLGQYTAHFLSHSTISQREKECTDKQVGIHVNYIIT